MLLAGRTLSEEQLDPQNSQRLPRYVVISADLDANPKAHTSTSKCQRMTHPRT